jgi:DNA-binding PadR family transcriptional regulator
MTDHLPNNSELALLTLLVEGPRHGYQLEQDIVTRGLRQWTEIGFSSIYYLLNRMQKQGWVTSEVLLEEGKPARRVYRVTESGLAAVIEAVRQRLADPAPLSGDFMLGLANQVLLPVEERLAAMRSFRQRLAGRLTEVQQKWQQNQAHMPPFVNDLFDHSQTMLQAELDWVNSWILKHETGRETE